MAEEKKPVKRIKYKDTLPNFFVCAAILIFGASSLISSGSLDYYTVLGTLIKVVPAAFIMGILGWVMGVVLDKKSKKSAFKNLGINNLDLDKILKEVQNEPEMGEPEEIDDIDRNEGATL